jgi:DNA-binding MarR family transcriptional regulator
MKYYEKLSNTYLSHFCRRLADLINEQGSEIIAEMKLDTPSTAISTVLFLDKIKTSTVANLAVELGVSHQMATQRINALEKLKLVTRQSSPLDKRAKFVMLTQKGQTEVTKLIPFTIKMNQAFNGLESELACELTQFIRKAEIALLKTPLKQRIN